jgi:hypothetical protein
MATFRETELHSVTGMPKLHEAVYDEVRRRMLDFGYDETLIGDEPIGNKGLFTTVMARIHYLDPEVIVLPAYSAVPLAYAVDSFYQTIDTATPQLTYIQANQHLTVRRDMRSPKIQRQIDDEVARFSSDYGGKTSVVLDHFTASGATLKLANEILTEAGVDNKESFSPYARWYFDIDEEDKIDILLERLHYPRHEKFMRDIGMRAANRLRPILTGSPQK